jgi:glycosyltransferase involved in cell wall biosynthesis
VRVVITAEQLQRRVPGGIGTYVRGLAQGLVAMGTDAPDVHLAGGEDGLGLPRSRLWWPPVVLTRGWDRGLLGVPGGRGLVHASTLAVPWRGGGPRVVTVHDLAWRVVPAAFPVRGRQWHEYAVARAVARAEAFVVPSSATAQALNVGDRATVIEEGCDHLPPPDVRATSALLTRLGVVGPYLLSVSTLEPRKNLGRLLEAYTAARRRLPEPWPFVVAGPAGWGPALPPVDGVVLAGSVPATVLSGLYNGARCVAYVPLVEGFGLPAVEAMRAGAPVVASPMPSIGDAGLVVDPLDAEAVADGLVAAANDSPARAALIAGGLARAAELSWEATARAHVEVWTRAAR